MDRSRITLRACVAGALMGLLSLGQASCGGGGGGGAGSSGTSPPPGGLPSWTVMQYVVGSNTLAIPELVNVKALEAIGSTANVNVVVEIQTGAQAGQSGAASGANQAVFGTPLDTSAKRFRVVKDPDFAHDTFVASPLTVPVITSPINVADRLGMIDMTSPDELGRFVAWAKLTYPAEKYALILCDHGGSWLGFGLDQSAGTFGNYAKLKSSLAAATAALGPGQRFDLLGFDACVMAALEVTTLAQPFGKVLVASETEEVAEPSATTKGSTWDYTDVLQDLVSSPGMDGRALATAIVNRTGDRYEGDHGAAPAAVSPVYTLSAIDLDAVAAVTSSWASFTQAHATLSSQDFHAFGQARAASPSFYSLSTTSGPILVDLEAFASNLDSLIPDPDLQATVQGAKAAVFAARRGPLVPRLTGLSLFMPLGQNESTVVPVEGTQEDYAQTDFAQTTGWGGLLGTFFTGMNGLTTPPVVTLTNTPPTTLAPGGSVNVLYSVAGADTAIVEGLVGIVNGGKIVVVNEFDQGQSGSVTGSFTWNGNVLLLTDGQSQSLLDFHPTGPGSTVYDSLLDVTPPGGTTTPVLAILTIDAASLTGKIVGLYNIEGGFIASIQPSLLVGATVTPLLRVLDPATSQISLATSANSVTITSGSPLNLSLTAVTTPVHPAQYAVGIVAKDFAGNVGFQVATVSVP